MPYASYTEYVFRIVIERYSETDSIHTIISMVEMMKNKMKNLNEKQLQHPKLPELK